MAIVTLYGRSYKDPASAQLAAPTQAEGRVRLISSGPIAIANGNSIGSRHYFGKMPSSAILIPALCVLYHSATTSLSDYDLGLELNGTIVDADLLADGLDLSSGSSKSAVATIGTVANIGKRLWEHVAGLTNDPAVEYDIVGTMNAAAGGAGTVNLMLGYAKK